jgi:hypothetical protein
MLLVILPRLREHLHRVGPLRAEGCDHLIVLDPKNNLKGDTRYRVKVTTEVKDGANNLQAAYRWSFKTKR